MCNFIPQAPQPIEQVLLFCYEQLEVLKQSGYNGVISIKCMKHRPEKNLVQCQSCKSSEFIVDLSTITQWKVPNLPSKRETKLDIPRVLELLNITLYATFFLWQGHALIDIAYREKDNVYGFRYQPSMLHGTHLW